MKAAILYNWINWTINKKHYLPHVKNKSPYEGKETE